MNFVFSVSTSAFSLCAFFLQPKCQRQLLRR
ncbi:hypothetical protein P5673_011225 [Acropora cervicornis]|uniref:Uncharacterized protein n=1 Tax=Acropora cervicornis TaxID=6130 RepID=A0AAD9QQJ0_ACRCE|nr:hypothetical protein P5673_011225 [Acropora cervicornis]